MNYDRSDDGLAEGCRSSRRPCSHQKTDPTSLCDLCDTRSFSPDTSQARLARVETMLADYARSEGRTPHGSVEQQLAEVLDRLHEQSKSDI